MEHIEKHVELLRDIAARRGEKITARDVVALKLAAHTLKALAAQLDKSSGIYTENIWQVVIAEANTKAMRESIAAILEIHE